MLKIAYFDLGFSKEQYGLFPTRYGGGGVAARYLKEDPEIEFHVFAPSEAFDNVGTSERRDRCWALPSTISDALKKGYPLDAIVGLDIERYDMVMHPHTCASLNHGLYRGPILHFAGFDGKCGHPSNDYVLLYDPSFTPQFGERAKYVRIGKPVPDKCPVRPSPFDSMREQPFLFQCSRLEGCMGAVEAAKACLEAGIKGVFAGPIKEGPLLEYIDGKTTFYLGEIDEVTKLDYCRRASLFSLLYAFWDPPFSQSIIEAQGQGCPIWVNNRGPFLKTYLKHGINGFQADGLNGYSLRGAFDRAADINPEECWKAAREYDTSVMIASFKSAFREIAAEWVPR